MNRVLSGYDYRITQHSTYYSGKNNVVTGNVHKGVDIVPVGATSCDIMAHSDGTILWKSSNSSYGNYVGILHDNGYMTFYAHLAPNSICVNVNDRVSKGQVIAHMGQTGVATGIHLHFEVRYGGGNYSDRVMPEDYLDNDLPNLATGGVVDDDTLFNLGDKVLVLNGYLTASPNGSGKHTGIYTGESEGQTAVKYVTKKEKGAIRPYHLSNGKELGDGDKGWGSSSQLQLLESAQPNIEPDPIPEEPKEEVDAFDKDKEIEELKYQISEMEKQRDEMTSTINDQLKTIDTLHKEIISLKTKKEEPIQYKATWNIEKDGYYEVYCHTNEILCIK